jgi:diaminopimelate epimerase
MNALHFTKMHGLGNDYVYISVFDRAVDDAAALARAISDRHRGVGSDGLILLAPATDPAAHVRMIMYNSDGSRAQMCGNGIRCLAKLALERGIAHANPLYVQTDSGVLAVEVLSPPGERVAAVRVDMGCPRLAPADMPVALAGERIVGHVIDVGGRALAMTCASMGNPHAVFFVPDVASIPLTTWGPAVECHPLFPERTNAHFVQVVDRQRVRMRTWERGAGATQACGTGASAVLVAAVLNGLTERRIVAQLPGGELILEWPTEIGHVLMTGPAEEVFDGDWPASTPPAAGL